MVAICASALRFGPVVLSRDRAAGHSAILDQSILVRTDGSPPAQRELAALTSAPVLGLRRGEEGTGIGQQTPPEV